MRLEIDASALAKFCESKPVSDLLQKACDRIATAANATLPEGDGYQVSSRTGRISPPSSDRVYTASNHAKNSNARHNTLVRLLGEGSAADAGRPPRSAAADAGQATVKRGRGRWTASELNLLYGKGLTNEEIAAKTGRTVGAVKDQRRQRRR